MSWDMTELYGRYGDELRMQAVRWRQNYHAMQLQRHGTTFSDVEGEILYMLTRETRPDVVFEISPDAGWSTGYLLAALTANGRGTLHSFELDRRIGGRSIEQAIRENQDPSWDQSRLHVHLGDARVTISGVGGEISLLFLDSAHDAGFARWYTDELFPRVRGPVVIHDIAFVDHREPSGESAFVLEWAAARQVRLFLAGDIEASLDHGRLRRGFPERRSLRSSTVFFRLPAPEQGPVPALRVSPEQLLRSAFDLLARGAPPIEIDRVINEAVARIRCGPTDPMQYRDYFMAGVVYARLGNAGESERSMRRALAFAVEADPTVSRKAFSALLDMAIAHRMWPAAGRISAVALASGEGRALVGPLVERAVLRKRKTDTNEERTS